MKYFFITLTSRRLGEKYVQLFHAVTEGNLHPLEYLSYLNQYHKEEEICLLNWKEITQEEFDLWNEAPISRDEINRKR